MKLNHKFVGLRVVVLGLLAITVFIYVSVMASAEQIDDKFVTSTPENRKMGAFFFRRGNEAPAFWGNPVVPTSYDATGKHGKLINKAKVFALYNAMASRAATINDKGVHEAPTLAFVIADHSLDGLQLAAPLKDILFEKWEGTPIATALNEPVMEYKYGDVIEGKDCSVFVSGTQNNNAPSHYVMNSAVIVASSLMTNDEISLCFRNKSALIFGLFARLFDYERNENPIVIDAIYFGYYPTFLELASLCREQEFDNVYGCLTRSVIKKYDDLLNYFTNDELSPVKETTPSR